MMEKEEGRSPQIDWGVPRLAFPCRCFSRMSCYLTVVEDERMGLVGLLHQH